MDIMAETRLRLRVSELLKEREWGAMDLIRNPKFEFSPATAYRLARNDADGVSLNTLNKLSEGFGVSIDDLFEREDGVEEKSV